MAQPKDKSDMILTFHLSPLGVANKREQLFYVEPKVLIYLLNY